MKRDDWREWMYAPIKKVAIIGGAPSRRYAPIYDKSWEIWGLGARELRLPRVDRWFELHSVPQLIRAYNRREKNGYERHIKFLRSLKVPVYMQKPHPGVPNSVTYPLDAVLEECGRCFTSSVSYMLGLAILEGYRGIGMWGVNMASKKEYLYQWAGVQYLLALAKQRGVGVYLPPDCPITIPSRPKLVPTKVLYGYDWDHPDAWWNKLQKEKESKDKDHDKKKKKKKKKEKRKRRRHKARKEKRDAKPDAKRDEKRDEKLRVKRDENREATADKKRDPKRDAKRDAKTESKREAEPVAKRDAKRDASRDKKRDAKSEKKKADVKLVKKKRDTKRDEKRKADRDEKRKSKRDEKHKAKRDRTRAVPRQARHVEKQEKKQETADRA